MKHIWFTADFHLGHANIIKHCARPFQDAAEMDETIIGNLNKAVRENDDLYFLGDFCLGGRKIADAYRQRVRCEHIFFIAGNHDQGARRIAEQFVWLKDLATVSIEGQRIVLCHYAMRVWDLSHHGSWHLYGHSHGKLPDDPNALSMDVGVDTHAFLPYHFDEVRSALAAKAESIQVRRNAALDTTARNRASGCGPISGGEKG